MASRSLPQARPLPDSPPQRSSLPATSRWESINKIHSTNIFTTHNHKLWKIGFKRIESLEEYTHLRSLWLDHNHLNRLGNGLAHMTQLKCLFIQSNSLTDLSGIEQLQQLAILDVSDNRIEDTNLLGINPFLIFCVLLIFIDQNRLNIRAVASFDDTLPWGEQTEKRLIHRIPSLLPKSQHSWFV